MGFNLFKDEDDDSEDSDDDKDGGNIEEADGADSRSMPQKM